MKATILYTFARIGVFVVLFALLRLTPLSVYLAAAVAAILALLISYIFFGGLRRGVADSIVRRRAAPERDEDADLEDAALDGPSTSADPSTSAARASSRRAAPPSEDD